MYVSAAIGFCFLQNSISIFACAYLYLHFTTDTYWKNFLVHTTFANHYCGALKKKILRVSRFFVNLVYVCYIDFLLLFFFSLCFATKKKKKKKRKRAKIQESLWCGTHIRIKPEWNGRKYEKRNIFFFTICMFLFFSALTKLIFHHPYRLLYTSIDEKLMKYSWTVKFSIEKSKNQITEIQSFHVCVFKFIKERKREREKKKNLGLINSKDLGVFFFLFCLDQQKNHCLYPPHRACGDSLKYLLTCLMYTSLESLEKPPTTNRHSRFR